MPALTVLAVACLLARLIRLSEARVNALHLKPLAIIMLVAAAITPTQDLLTDLMLAAPLFAACLGYTFVRTRIAGSSPRQP